MEHKGGSGRIADRRDDHVDRAEIVQAAMTIIDEDGLDGLSMRRLAAAVGLRAPSLYHHFPSKAAVVADVLDLLWDEASDDISFEATIDPVDTCVAILVSLRRSFLGHPDMATFVGVVPRPGERMIESIDNLRAIIAVLGFPEDRQAFDVIRTYVTGAISLAASQVTASEYLGRDADTVLAWLDEHDPEGPGPEHDERMEYLRVAASLPSEATFEWGLRRLIEGLRGREDAS